MKRNIGRYISLFALIIVALTTVAIAKGDGFKDVVGKTAYADDILYLREHGITGGYADGTFRPNEVLTARAAYSMLAKAFPGNSDYARTIAMMTDLNRDCKMLAEYACEAAFAAKNTIIYNAEFYGDETPSSLRAAYEFRIFPAGSYEPMGFMKRGEFAHLLVSVIKKEYVQVAPVQMKELNVTFEPEFYNGKNVNQYLSQLKYFPEEIKHQFREKDWQIIIGDDAIHDYEKIANMTHVGGLTDYNEKTITVSSTSLLAHEMGHFVYGEMLHYDSSRTIAKLYSTEKESAEKLIRAYAGTNEFEFFAEEFAWFYTKSVLSDKHRVAQGTANPGIYQYLYDFNQTMQSRVMEG